MKPVYQIKTYTGVTLDYTFSNDTSISGAVNDATEIKFKHVITSNVGTFSFKLPAKKGKSNMYYDIAGNDLVKIWFDYNNISVVADPNFVGKVYQIYGIGNRSNYWRVIKGRDQGEVLQRRMKGATDWSAVGASTIAADLADDIGLGTGDIEADATAETHRIDIDKHECYFSLLQKVSDYWANAGTQVKKDFRVDEDNDLYWEGRPWRTAGVETLSVGTNIRSYQVLRDYTPIKNKIWVYGQKLKPQESTKDAPTEMADAYKGSTVDVESASGQKVLSVASTADFSVDDTIFIHYSEKVEENVVDTIDPGVSLTCENNLANTYPVATGVYVYPGWAPVTANTTVSTDAVTYLIGSKSTEIVGAAGGWCGAEYKWDGTVNLNHYPSVNFYLQANSEVSGFVRLWDDAGLSSYKRFNAVENDSEFHFISLMCGRDNEDGWVIESGFDWTSVYSCEISMMDGTMTYYVDGLFLNHRRFSDCAEDGTSQSDYEIREMVVVDDSLISDSDCEKRAETLLYQLKDPPIRIDVVLDGNTNVLVGDRLSMTIPAENISAANYDVVEVTQTFMPKPLSFTTAATLVNSANVRDMPAINLQGLVRKHLINQREIGRGVGLQK